MSTEGKEEKCEFCGQPWSFVFRDTFGKAHWSCSLECIYSAGYRDGHSDAIEYGL